MKTFLKNKKIMAGFLALALLLTGVISVLGFDNVIAYAMGSEEHWTKEDFLYSIPISCAHRHAFPFPLQSHDR